MDSGNTFFVGLQGGPPWGFRLQGGREYRAPLSVTKVNENSKAEAADMQIGDIVKSINGTNCDNMTHSEALSTIRRAGMQLQIVLERQDHNSNDNYGNVQNYRSGGAHQYDNPNQGYQHGNQNVGARVPMGNNRRSRASQDDYDQQPQDNYNYQGRYQNPSGSNHGQNYGTNYNDNYGRPDNNQNSGRNAQMQGKNSWVPNNKNNATTSTNVNDSRRQFNHKNRANNRIRGKKSVASKKQFIEEFGRVNTPNRKLVKNSNSSDIYIPLYDDPLQPLPGHEPQDEPKTAPLSPILAKFEKPSPPYNRRLPTREGLRNVYSSPDYFSKGGFDNVRPIDLSVPALNLLHRQREFLNDYKDDGEDGIIVHSAYRSKNKKKFNKINTDVDGVVKDQQSKLSNVATSPKMRSPTTSPSGPYPTTLNSKRNNTTKINNVTPTRETTKLNAINKSGSYNKDRSSPGYSTRKENERANSNEKAIKPLYPSVGSKNKVVIRTTTPRSLADNDDRTNLLTKKKNSSTIKPASPDRTTTRLKIRKNNPAPESPTAPVEQINATSLEALESVDNNSSNEELPPVRIPAKPDAYRQDYEDDWSNNDQGGGFWPQKTEDRKEDDSSGGRTYNTLPNQRHQNSFQPIQPSASQKPLSRTGSVKSLGNDYNQPQYNENYDPRYQPRYNENEDYRSGGWQDNSRFGGVNHSKSTPSLAQPEDDQEQQFGRNKYYDDRNDNQDSRYHDHNRPFRHDDNESRKSDGRKYEDDTDYHTKAPDNSSLNDIEEKGLIFDAPPNYNIHDKIIPKCKAIYSFKPASKRELALKKGDLVMLTKNVDKNWYEGELHGKRGIFPANHIEVVTSIKEALAAQCEYSHDGLGQARRDFTGVTSKELSFSKGQIITLLKHVDANWFEGRLNARSGLVPKKFISVIKDLKNIKNVGSMKQPRNNRNKDYHEDNPRHDRSMGTNANQYFAKPHDYQDNNQPADDGYNSYYDNKPQYQDGDHNYQSQGDYYSQDTRSGRNYRPDADTRSAGGYDAGFDAGNDPYNNRSQQQRHGGTDNRNNNNYDDYNNNNRRSQRYQAEVDYSDSQSQSGNRKKNPDYDQNNYYNDGAADNSNFSPANTELSERYRAFYPYAPEKEDELELLVGDIIIVKEKCDDGWFVGSSTRTGLYGTFPGNFVEPVY